MTGEKRVCFDFEVTFSNGGGIQGQDFRLDLDGDDIDDDALAIHIIRDMRLLMVGDVRILNKCIVEEQHKRTNHFEDDATGVDARSVLIDLSHTIENDMITCKGLPAPLIRDHLSRTKSRETYADGTEFQIGRIEMVGNTGAYIDVPFHRYADGYDLAGLALDRVSDVPGVVVRVGGARERAIDWQHFAPYDCRNRAVLVHTGWDRNWRTDAYFEGHPYLTEKAAIHLRDEGARVVGIDSSNIDDTTGGTRPVHSVLLAAGIPVVEHLTNLASLPADGFRFHAAPPKVSGMGTFPVRAHAVIEQPERRCST